ncbi:MAG: hypothetical protein V3V16_11820 [Melioribacteraceae bacterium]
MKHKIKFLTIILFFFLTGIVSAQNWDQIIKLVISDRWNSDEFGH